MHTHLLTAEDAYLICFGLGLVLSIAAFAGGFGHLHLGHLHFGHVRGPHVHGARGAHADATISPLNGFTMLVFLAWFGGAGYLLRHYTALWGLPIFALALLSGLAGAGIVFWFLARVLLPRERVLTDEDTEMTGVLARVSSPIRAGGMGEIAYTQGGARRAAPARSEAGATIERDAEVVVLRYERGIAYVRTLAELEGQPHP